MDDDAPPGDARSTRGILKKRPGPPEPVDDAALSSHSSQYQPARRCV